MSNRVKAVPHYKTDPTDPNGGDGISDYARNVFEVLSQKDRAREQRKIANANSNLPTQPIATMKL
jgi:hypothetical protein